ncbi:hypothetical protein LZG74_05725 [Dyadobacter sp. CY327]|uniref:DUF6973 domain-containing protein n=1 Tax=Dyadobacter sp. CY327 TaxID=2907301 RepID=UPI001F441449|nr:hypothetical protein [Dyadobacter sp. CY327]MCE7069789.1 hypothetical protein [Dyadobacter sp. CY327]
MKLNLGKAASLLIFGFTILSCNDPKLEQTSGPNASEKAETIEFKGERVIIPIYFPKELFGQTQEEFDAYYEKAAQGANVRSSGERALITYEELLRILVTQNAKYPTINSEEGVLEKDLERIYRDFPDIETHAEANEKRAVVYDYYQTLCKRDVVAEVIALENAKNARTNGPSPGSLTKPEKNHLLLNPGLAQHYIQAAKDVEFLTPSIFGNNDDDNKANAFKHATWNALSIRYILKGSPVSENQAIDFTQDGTSKHEQDDNGNQVHTQKEAMDLHNNMSARVWMESETKWGFGPFRSIPKNDEIINTFVSRANSSSKHTMTDILNLHGGNVQNTWNNLYNNLYGPYQHLVNLNSN